MMEHKGYVVQTIIYLLLVIVLGDSGTIAVRSSMYSEKHLVDAKICDPRGYAKAVIKVPRITNSGLIITPSYMFDHWDNVLTDFHCKFIVKAPKGEHLFAVIQNISFRKNGSECLDYVMFKTNSGGYTEKFCGSADRRKLKSLEYSEGMQNWVTKNRSSNYGEYEPNGEIETIIFVSKQSAKDEEQLNVTIVYTPYKDCEKVNSEDYRTTRSEVCIWRNYFCDGLQNCFANICDDEGSCPDQITSNGTGTKVTIGAVTTIILCFIIFMMGLWTCRRHKKLCWSPDCAGPEPQNPRLGQESTQGNPSVAVSPMLEISVLPSTLDKDLPPSYDSLFPEQANGSTT